MTIYTGETVRLTAVFKDQDGTETDVNTGTAKVRVFDPYGTEKLTVTAGTKRSNTTSTYDYYYDIPTVDSDTNTYETGYWVHVWQGTTTVGTQEWDTIESKQFEVRRFDKPPTTS